MDHVKSEEKEREADDLKSKTEMSGESASRVRDVVGMWLTTSVYGRWFECGRHVVDRWSVRDRYVVSVWSVRSAPVSLPRCPQTTSCRP